MNAFRLLVTGACLAVMTAPALAAPKVQKPAPLPASASAAPVELIEETDGLKINWTTGRVSVSGIGVGGDRGPASYRRTLSSRAALADAYRRLAHSLDLVRVDANTRLKDLAVADDALRTRLSEFVKSAQVLETNHWPDGSTEIVLGADLRGASSLASLIAGVAPADAAATAAAAPAKEVVTAPVPVHATHSSVIVDARGLGAQPALMPQLRDGEGKVIELSGAPSVKYLDEGAEFDKAAGLNPLKLKAGRTQGMLRADLVLADDAAKALKKALVDGKITGETTVIVVI